MFAYIFGIFLSEEGATEKKVKKKNDITPDIAPCLVTLFALRNAFRLSAAVTCWLSCMNAFFSSVCLKNEIGRDEIVKCLFESCYSFCFRLRRCCF